MPNSSSSNSAGSIFVRVKQAGFAPLIMAGLCALFSAAACGSDAVTHPQVRGDANAAAGQTGAAADTHAMDDSADRKSPSSTGVGSAGSIAANATQGMSAGSASKDSESGSRPAPEVAADPPRSASPDKPHENPPPEPAHPYAVGTVRLEIAVTPDRKLPVQLWYPAAESAREQARAGRSVLEFETGARRDTLQKLLKDAPACTHRTMHAADAPEALSRTQAFPLLVFSHCMDCLRFSSFSLAEQLAAAGFVVAAADHEHGTLYDREAGNSVGIDLAFLDQRVADVRAVASALLDPASNVTPKTLRGHLDADRLGVFGHSFGAVTTGSVLAADPHFRAGALMGALAAVPDELRPLLDVGPQLKSLRQPAMFMIAREDNSVTELVNAAMRNNFWAYSGEAWRFELDDAGHYSFSDIVGIQPDFMPGCGEDYRQTAPFERFRYLDLDVALARTGTALVEFFQHSLEGATGGLDTHKPQPGTILEHVTPMCSDGFARGAPSTSSDAVLAQTLNPSPEGVGVCPNGDVFVGAADTLWRIAAGSGKAERFATLPDRSLEGIACDAQGRIFVADISVATSLLTGETPKHPAAILLLEGKDQPPKELLAEAKDEQLSGFNGLVELPGLGLYATDTLAGLLFRFHETSPGHYESSIVARALPGANGLAYDPWKHVLYVALTGLLQQDGSVPDSQVVAFVMQDDGTLGARSSVWHGTDTADGLAIDDRGVLYRANQINGTVTRMSDEVVIANVPNPASLAFRGGTLYVSDFKLLGPLQNNGDGGVYAIELGVCGGKTSR
jgi:sugar lactone lactonase YvrE/dienelactone hydrolase